MCDLLPVLKLFQDHLDLLGIISFPLPVSLVTRLQLYVSFQSFTFADAQIYFYMLEKCRNTSFSTVFQESMLHEYCSVCVFVYAVRQGCVLCKSLAGASSQPGGQTRKQMDWFGLNPSHAILSSWPSLPPHPTCTPRSAK